MGHPYFAVVDNSTGFEEKINRVIAKVCEGLRKRGVDVPTDDRLKAHSKKRKFLVRTLPDKKVNKFSTLKWTYVTLSGVCVLFCSYFHQCKTLMCSMTT